MPSAGGDDETPAGPRAGGDDATAAGASAGGDDATAAGASAGGDDATPAGPSASNVTGGGLHRNWFWSWSGTGCTRKRALAGGAGHQQPHRLERVLRTRCLGPGDRARLDRGQRAMPHRSHGNEERNNGEDELAGVTRPQDLGSNHSILTAGARIGVALGQDYRRVPCGTHNGVELYASGYLVSTRCEQRVGASARHRHRPDAARTCATGPADPRTAGHRWPRRTPRWCRRPRRCRAPTRPSHPSPSDRRRG